MGYLIVLIWLGLVAGIIWAYSRKQRQREAERAKQYDALLADLKSGRASAAGTPAAVPVAAEAPAAPVAEFLRKDRLLQQPAALLYYVFRTGLPDHEIFAGLTLADVIDIAPSLRGYEREQKARRLAQQKLDLVICSRQLEVVAAVLVTNAMAAAQPSDTSFAAECLQEAGIRLVRVDAAALPRHHQVRELVYGADASRP
jgi:uncharacterized protein DUF2726